MKVRINFLPNFFLAVFVCFFVDVCHCCCIVISHIDRGMILRANDVVLNGLVVSFHGNSIESLHVRLTLYFSFINIQQVMNWFTIAL